MLTSATPLPVPRARPAAAAHEQPAVGQEGVAAAEEVRLAVGRLDGGAGRLPGRDVDHVGVHRTRGVGARPLALVPAEHLAVGQEVQVDRRCSARRRPATRRRPSWAGAPLPRVGRRRACPSPRRRGPRRPSPGRPGWRSASGLVASPLPCGGGTAAGRRSARAPPRRSAGRWPTIVAEFLDMTKRSPCYGGERLQVRPGQSTVQRARLISLAALWLAVT